MPCRQNLQSKSKQIETNTGSFCKHSQGLPVFCMESIDAWRTVFGAGEKSRCDQGMCDRGQANCRAGRICKVKPKQIKTETGSSCKHSQELPVFCMESVLSLEQAKKSLQPRHQGQAAGNSRRRGQADCRAGRICKVKCKQIETNTGSSCKCSQGLPVLCMERISSLEQAKKVVVTKECVTEGKQPEILDAEGKPIAVQAESAK